MKNTMKSETLRIKPNAKANNLSKKYLVSKHQYRSKEESAIQSAREIPKNHMKLKKPVSKIQTHTKNSNTVQPKSDASKQRQTLQNGINKSPKPGPNYTVKPYKRIGNKVVEPGANGNFAKYLGVHRWHHVQIPKRYPSLNDINVEHSMDFWRALRFKVSRKAMRYRITQRVSSLAEPRKHHACISKGQQMPSDQQGDGCLPKRKKFRSSLEWKAHIEYVDRYLAQPRYVPETHIEIDRGKRVSLKSLIDRINQLSKPKQSTRLESRPKRRHYCAARGNRRLFIRQPSERIIQLAMPKSYSHLSSKSLSNRTDFVLKCRRRRLNSLRLVYLATPKVNHREGVLLKEKEAVRRRRIEERKLWREKQKQRRVEERKKLEQKENDAEKIEMLKKLTTAFKTHRPSHRKEYQAYKNKLEMAYRQLKELKY